MPCIYLSFDLEFGDSFVLRFDARVWPKIVGASWLNLGVSPSFVQFAVRDVEEVNGGLPEIP